LGSGANPGFNGASGSTFSGNLNKNQNSQSSRQKLVCPKSPQIFERIWVFTYFDDKNEYFDYYNLKLLSIFVKTNLWRRG
jgi:hypothetical protein